MYSKCQTLRECKYQLTFYHFSAWWCILWLQLAVCWVTRLSMWGPPIFFRFSHQCWGLPADKLFSFSFYFCLSTSVSSSCCCRWFLNLYLWVTKETSVLVCSGVPHSFSPQPWTEGKEVSWFPFPLLKVEGEEDRVTPEQKLACMNLCTHIHVHAYREYWLLFDG